MKIVSFAGLYCQISHLAMISKLLNTAFVRLSIHLDLTQVSSRNFVGFIVFKMSKTSNVTCWLLEEHAS